MHGGSTAHACEWNPEAVKALRWGLEANGVGDRCTIHEGDSRIAAQSLGGVADRVFLGLLPSSEEGLEAAMGVLSPSGGTLHVHGLAPSKDHSSWGGDLLSSASSLRPGSDLSHDLTRVKSYAPHWDHVVLDLMVA